MTPGTPTPGSPNAAELSPLVAPGVPGDFRYSHGDRPLDGYTIQRGIGRGGFGEVYYALSDSGREVAIKALVSHEQIELRGIGQCMNLKSPHLVSIFDVRRNALGRSFVIMEYVRGPSLQQILSETPGGLGPQKAAFFLREIAKGLTYLHDCGVVHRDLKPGNIFYEDGYVKICDYGLAKAMSESVNSGQTTTVGTVHYMAPEIGAGRYDKSIDIYALGVILYEMLTGTVPFLGQSPAEVIAKHLSAEPDLRGIEEPFATAIRRAMDKDVNRRFRSVQEMVEAVFGSEHIRMSVSHFRPESLSMAAERVAARVKPTGGSSAPPPLPKNPRLTGGTGGAKGRPHGWADRLEQRIGTVAERASERVKHPFGGRGVNGASWIDEAPAASRLADPLELRQRVTLAVITAGLMGVAAGFFAGSGAAAGLITAAAGLGGAMALRFARGHFGKFAEQDDGTLAYLMLGGAAAIGAVAPAGFLLVMTGLDTHSFFEGGEMLFAIGGVLLLTNWNERTRADREERLSLWHAIGWGFCAYVVANMFDSERTAVLAASIVAATSLVAQVLSPFHPPAGGAQEDDDDDDDERPERDPRPGGIDLNIKIEKQAAEPKAAAFAPSDAPTTIDPPAHTEEISPRRNLIALILCSLPFVMFPVGGLHRFYAGKIGTGILWLLTCGLFFIGQTVDLIMILCGEFKDAEGRTMRIWLREEEVRDAAPGPGPAPALRMTPLGVGHRIATARRRTPALGVGLSLGGILCSLAGTLLLLAAFAIGLWLAIDGFGLMAAVPDIARDFEDAFGPGWNHPATELFVIMGCAVGMVGLMLLMLGRRGRGVFHMLRPIPAVAMLGFSLFVLSGVFDRVDWADVVIGFDDGRPGLFVRQMIDEMHLVLMIPAGVLLLAGVVVLLWPPKPVAAREKEGGA